MKGFWLLLVEILWQLKVIITEVVIIHVYIPQSGATGSLTNNEDTENNYDALVNQAYNKLFLLITANSAVVNMTDLMSRLITYLQDLGANDEVKYSTKKHLRQWLKDEFGESLHIIPNKTGKLLVFHDNLPINELDKENQSLEAELSMLKSSESVVIMKAALQLRADKTKQNVSQAWPPQTDKSYIPDSMLQFLHTLLSGDPATVSQSERVERLSNYFGQDMVSALTNGKQKPPKHIQLPFAVKLLSVCLTHS